MKNTSNLSKIRRSLKIRIPYFVRRLIVRELFQIRESSRTNIWVVIFVIKKHAHNANNKNTVKLHARLIRNSYMVNGLTLKMHTNVQNVDAKSKRMEDVAIWHATTVNMGGAGFADFLLDMKAWLFSFIFHVLYLLKVCRLIRNGKHW